MYAHRSLLPLLAGLLAAPLALAQYKVIGPDGKVTYTDQPPPATAARVEPLRTGGGGASAGDLSMLPVSLRQIAQRYPVVLYAGRNCGLCDAGRDLLVQRGIPFAEKRVESPQDVEAFARLAGRRTLPLLTVGSQQVKSLSVAEWHATLDAAGYPRSSALPASYRRPAATPLVAAPVAEGAGKPASAPAPAPEPEPATAPATGGPAIRF